MVLVGNINAPKSHCGSFNGDPITTIKRTPIIAEKPFIRSDGTKFSLMVPKIE